MSAAHTAREPARGGAARVGVTAANCQQRAGGTRTAPLASMMKTVKHTFSTIGDRSSDLARQLGSGTADFANRIGPRRGLIALAVVAAAIGGSVVLMRLRRARRAESQVARGSSPSISTPNGVGRGHQPSAMPGTH